MQNCIHLKQKLNHSLECKKKKKIINIKDCSNCKFKDFPKTKTRPKKSSAIQNAERNRFSVFTKDLEHCIICGNKKEHLHEIFFGKNRNKSMKYGFVIPLCFQCHLMMHRNKQLQEAWHIRGQLYWEEHLGSKNEFIAIFRKNYI